MASTYLTRTPSSAGNRKTWTWSAWIKLGVLGTPRNLFGAYAHAADNLAINIADTDTVSIRFYNNTEYQLGLNRVFRDTSAWYHLVFAIDTTLATEADRFIIYVNGVRETSFQAGANSQPTLDLQMTINEATATQIGRFNTGSYFDGEMSHINFIDGTAYDATAFGEYDANGVWTIKTSPSVTYGTNGFFILKNGNSVTDQSGNSNNFTVGGGTLTNTEDSPSNVFATWNPLVPLGSFSYGNTVWDSVSSGDGSAFSTLGAEAGKYYMECKVTTSNTDGWELGVAPAQRLDGAANGVGTTTIGGVGYTGDGNIRRAGSTVASGQTTFSQNDIIGCALDMDTRKVYFYKNGTALYGGVGVDLPSTTGAYLFGTGDWWGGVATQSTANFGNGYFGTTAVTDAGTNASGIGIFEYDVPTGFTALSTKGLNL